MEEKGGVAILSSTVDKGELGRIAAEVFEDIAPLIAGDAKLGGATTEAMMYLQFALMQVLVAIDAPKDEFGSRSMGAIFGTAKDEE